MAYNILLVKDEGMIGNEEIEALHVTPNCTDITLWKVNEMQMIKK